MFILQHLIINVLTEYIPNKRHFISAVLRDDHRLYPQTISRIIKKHNIGFINLRNVLKFIDNNGSIYEYDQKTCLFKKDGRFYTYKEIITQLKEHVLTVNLKTWNVKQKELWSSMENKGLVKKNDYVTFMKFAKHFDEFYRKNNRFPSLKEIEKNV